MVGVVGVVGVIGDGPCPVLLFLLPPVAVAVLGVDGLPSILKV